MNYDVSEGYRNETLKKIMLLLTLLSVLMIVLLMACTAGCITASKQAYAEFTATPIQTTPPTPEPTPTPIPEPTFALSEAQKLAMSGGHYQGEWYSWQKDNVSGYKDMSMHVTVYDYRILGTVEWWSISWGKYFRAGAGEGRKFLFIFAHVYSDEGMARAWGIQPHQFKVQINDTLYDPYAELLPEIRLHEFDDIWDLNHVENIKPYGYRRYYDQSGKEMAEALGFLKAGKSNAWDGYIVYSIPKDTKPEDIKVIGNFHDLAESQYWQLTNEKYKR